MPGYIVEALLYFQHINDNNDYINNAYGPHRIQHLSTEGKHKWQRSITLIWWIKTKSNYCNTGNSESTHPLPQLLRYKSGFSSDTSSKWYDFTQPLRRCIPGSIGTEAQLRAGGFTYLGNNNNKIQIINGSISIIVKIIKSVMSFAAELEVGALFMNARKILPLRPYDMQRIRTSATSNTNGNQ